jgi:hypothetical protein
LAEVLVEYPDVIAAEDGTRFLARACGKRISENSWHGWIEFSPIDGGEMVRSPRETTQPNRTGAVYWATGLTPVYLEGALHRALRPPRRRPVPPLHDPAFDGPAPDFDTVASDATAILDPFAVYAKSEDLLRRQLAALSTWHLANIVRAYGIPAPGDPNRLGASELIEAIISSARMQAGTATPE